MTPRDAKGRARLRRRPPAATRPWGPAGRAPLPRPREAAAGGLGPLGDEGVDIRKYLVDLCTSACWLHYTCKHVMHR